MKFFRIDYLFFDLSIVTFAKDDISGNKYF